MIFFESIDFFGQNLGLIPIGYHVTENEFS
jgi:hypothetical protein